MPIRVEFQGQIHEFPDGTPDAVIAVALGGDAATPVASHGTDIDTLERDFPGIRQHLAAADRAQAETLPSQLAMGASFAVGPAVIPGALAAGGAAYLANRLQGADRGTAASRGIAEGAGSLGAGVITKIPAALNRVARRAVKGGLKVPVSYLQQMSTARQSGLMGAEDELVDTTLRERINPVTKRGYDQLQTTLDEAARAREAKIQAAPDVSVAGSGAAQEDALLAKIVRNMDMTDDSVGEIRAILSRYRENPKYGAPQTAAELAAGRPPMGTPRDLTPRELAARVEADNLYLRKKFGEAKGPTIEAVKSVRNANAQNLDAATGTGDISQRMKRLIDLRNVSNVARRRAESKDVVGITDVISLSAGRPEVLGVTTAMRPATQVGIGLGLDKARQLIPLPSHATRGERETIQAILRALLGSESEP